MAYSVGQRDIKIDGKTFSTGAQLPSELVEQWPSRNQLLIGGHIKCDFKNGEVDPRQVSHIRQSSILTDEVIVDSIEKLGIAVPSDAPQALVHLVYNVFVRGQHIDEASAQLRVKPVLPSWVPRGIREELPQTEGNGLDVEALRRRASMVELPKGAFDTEDTKAFTVTNAEGRAINPSEASFMPLPEPIDPRVLTLQNVDERKQLDEERELLRREKQKHKR